MPFQLVPIFANYSVKTVVIMVPIFANYSVKTVVIMVPKCYHEFMMPKQNNHCII